jgi:hypothetical protein
MDRHALVAVIEASWQTLDEAIGALAGAALSEPGVVGEWSVVELIGHVSAWEQQALRHIAQWRAGEPLTALGGPDAYNAAEAERRRGWTAEQALAEQAETRRQLRETILSLSDADWAAPVALGERRGTLGDVVGGDLGGDGPGDHAAEHARHIRDWRARREDGMAR